MPLRTTRAFSIGGRRYKAGDPIELAGKHLRLFQAIGYVEYGPEEYQTQQLVPEPAAEPAAAAETSSADESAPKSRRNYRRRDLKAGE
jgi:hypothetical protein